EQRIEDFQDVRHASVVHPEGAAFLILGNGLNHRPENVWIDLRPVEAADMQEISTGDPTETRRVYASGKKLAVNIGEGVSPSWNPGARPILAPGVHSAEQFGYHLMGVG